MHQNQVHFSTITNDQAIAQNKTWKKGAYNFLLQRTINEYNKTKTTQRRLQVASSLNIELPIIKDDLLKKLYLKTSSEYQTCLKKKVNSGYDLTAYEVSFMNSFLELQSNISKLDNVELIPFAGTTRMPIGPYLPDFLLIGLSMKGSSLLAIEIDGGIHSLKQSKDFSKEDDLSELGIVTLNIQNNMVSNLDFLSKLFNDEKIINLNTRSPEQIKTILRRIWVKTIVNHWPFERIEMELNMESGLKFNLIKEFHELVQHSKCPRSIKDEYKKIY